MAAQSEALANHIREMGAQLEPQIIEYRRTFHRHPELSTKEFETSQRLCDELDKLGIEYRRVQGPRPTTSRDGKNEFIGTGIIATIRGEAEGAYDASGNPAKRIALRTDMDALPVTERTEVDFKSENAGVMHACGHDCHMAMMLGAAQIIYSLRQYLRGEVRILFQPAEEISLGSLDMIAAGALEGVDAIYGQHIWSEVEAGTVSCEPGRRMANTDWFRVDVEGVSAHGSMPHKGVDAIVVGAQMIESLQMLVSRSVSPYDPVVLTVGEFHGGEARNIMAGHAWFTGTVRTLNMETREFIADHMERIVGKVARAFGANAEFTWTPGNPGLINNEELAEVARQSVVDILGEEGVASYEGTLAGEDFAEYTQLIPGVFVFIGTRNPAVGAEHPQHSCFYTVDESVFKNGSMVAAQWAAHMLA